MTKSVLSDLAEKVLARASKNYILQREIDNPKNVFFSDHLHENCDCIAQTKINPFSTSFVEFIGQHAKIKIKKKGNSYVARCPFHYENTPSFVVYENGTSYRCLSCGIRGSSIIDFVKQFANITERQ